MSQEELLTIKQVCGLLRKSRVWLYERMKAGEITYIRLGRTVLFKQVDIDAFLQRNVVNAKAAAKN
ncbi:MAG: helix-turn-helix transcriptional regulator [Pyrinomonadaceae bacterium]